MSDRPVVAGRTASGPTPSDWIVRFDGYLPAQEGVREALCTLGNGSFATRGAAEEVGADGVHYPGTYLAGGYNRLTTEIAGRTIENDDLVNWPNWLGLTFRAEGADWFTPGAYEILDWTRELDLGRGLLTRTVRVRDPLGRRTRLVYRRLVSLADRHVAGLALALTPEDWSGQIEFRVTLDGRVRNAGVARYAQLADRHLAPVSSETLGPDGVALFVRTTQSRLTVALAARTRMFRGTAVVPADPQVHIDVAHVAQHLSCEAIAGKTIDLEKIVALATSRDLAPPSAAVSADAKRNPLRATLSETLEGAGRFDGLLAAHATAWRRVWDRYDVTVRGQPRTQRLLRLHAFHLLQTASEHTRDLDVSVPARGLHGEAYRGHIFWDELFIFPFFTFRQPELTRSLLAYRYRRLPQARAAAQRAGYAGAMFPWQSSSDGREESQIVHLNPASGRWVPDHSALQRHVNVAVAYNVWQYYQASLDMEFLAAYGAELLLDVARFWSSAAHLNPQRGRYEIHGVMGPDEYHEAYPDTDEPGLRNNAYTNVMAVWTLLRALDVLDLLPTEHARRLQTALDVTAAERDRWADITRKMYVPTHRDGRGDEVVSQFEGFETLRAFDWHGYREKYGDIHRLDRILEAEHDSADRYQVAKQADVLMLFYLLSAAEVQTLFQRLGYRLDDDAVRRNVDYYFQRTSHGSTLSRVVHAWVLARLDPVRSWQLFSEALESDVNDIQGGTTAEGIHTGVMAGTLDLVLRCYLGMEPRGDTVWFAPCLPPALRSGVEFRMQYRGNRLAVETTPDRLRITRDAGGPRPARVGMAGRVVELVPGRTHDFALPAAL